MARSHADPPSDEAISAAILGLLARRRPGATICPSEAARSLDPLLWRDLMAPVRRIAARLAVDGVIAVTQKGKPVDPAAARGPIRLRLRKPEGTPDRRST